jgi:hypothetical protein
LGRILALNPAYDGMSAIVNVLGRVGPGEANSPDDVRVVQRLLQMCARGKAFAGSIGVPQVTGHFDATTGFWIYQTQSAFKRQVVDGVVSPAHGAHYAPGGGIWTIVLFNDFAKANCPHDYATFLAQSTT